MTVLHRAGVLAAGVALAATAALATDVPSASATPAYINCGQSYYTISKHKVEFNQAAEIIDYNHSNRSSKVSQVVGEAHKSKTSYGGSITAGAEASFWKFASASASVKAHIKIVKTKVMSSKFTATGTAAPHSRIVLQYGFSRYNQYVRHMQPYSKTQSTCGTRVIQQGWVDSPYANTFIVSN